MRAGASLTLINLEIFIVMKFILKMNFCLDWEPRFNGSNCNHKLDLDWNARENERKEAIDTVEINQEMGISIKFDDFRIKKIFPSLPSSFQLQWRHLNEASHISANQFVDIWPHNQLDSYQKFTSHFYPMWWGHWATRGLDNNADPAFERNRVILLLHF